MNDPALRAALDAGAHDLGLALDAQALDRLLAYLGLLGRWGKVHNLTAVRDPARMLTLHLLDSLAVVPPLRRRLAGRQQPRLLDVGCGAGLPAVALAVACPELVVHGVDAVAKKAGFVRQVALELGLPNLHAWHGRVETLRLPGAGFDVVASRAFASLADFTALTRGQLAPQGLWMAMKGQPPGDELAALPAGVELLQVDPLQVPGLAAQRCLVWLRCR